MKLTCENAPPCSDVTEEAILKAFLDDDGRGSFIILSESDQVFIQAAGEGTGPYTLEYREGDETRHHQCLRQLARSEVQSAFLKYLRRDASFKTDYQWSALEEKPWWRIW